MTMTKVMRGARRALRTLFICAIVLARFIS
jgi:hypothetical protein